MKIIEKLGRAGNYKNREQKRQIWDLKYGKGKWEVMYVYKDLIMTRDKALDEYYNKSYYLYLKNNPHILDELCRVAKEIYNPHAVNTGGVDLQCPAVEYSLQQLKRNLEGDKKIAIGTWGTKQGIKYPDISYKLSPFKVPLWDNECLSVEEFWQEYKYLIIKE